MAFIERKSCDACGETTRLKGLISIPYATPLLSTNISERYKGKLTAEEFGDIPYEVIRCETCGFLFQKYIPDDEMSQRLYSYEESRIERSMSKKRDASIDYFVRYAQIVEKGLMLIGKKPHETTVLDFGSGWGYFLRMASAHGAPTEGVEISKERSDYSRSAGLTIHGSIEDTRPQHDFIYSDQTFEHIPSPLTYLKMLSNRLSSNGIMYIAVPNCKNTEKVLKTAHKHIVTDLYPIEHINGFRNKSLRALAKCAGLEIIPPLTICKSLAKNVRLTSNGQFLQEALKAFFTQHMSTSLWLRKKNL